MGPHTVTRAYRILCNSGLVQKIGKRFLVGSIVRDQPPRTRFPILVAAESGRDLYGLYRDDPFAEAFRSMEVELRRKRYPLRYLTIDEFSSNAKSRTRSLLDRCSGVVFARLRKEQALELRPLMKKVAAHSGAPGILVDCYSSAVLGIGKAAVVLSRHRIELYMIRALVKNLIALSAHDITLVLASQDESYLATQTFAGVFREAVPEVAFRVVELYKECDGSVPDLDSTIRNPSGAASRRLRAVLDRVYRMNSSSVWVCVQARSAALVSSWATVKGIRFGRDLRLYAMFDDPSIATAGISAVDFDMHHLGYLLARHLIGDISVDRTEQGFLKHSGVLLERGTSLGNMH